MLEPKAKKYPRRDVREASIFFLSIWILIFFSIISVAIYKLASAQIRIAKTIKTRVISKYLAKAAYVYAFIDRENDDTSYDSLYELSYIRKGTLGSGEFSYKFIDEESKININTASKKVLRSLPEVDEKLAEDIFESELKPFSVEEEVLLVEGMTEGIYDEFKDDITVYGRGKVNINTASVSVLEILGMDEDLADIIIEYRQGFDNIEGTEDDGIFEKKGSILKDLRSFRGLFLEQEQQLIILLELLDVKAENLELQLDTKVLEREAISYKIIIDNKGIVRWQET